MQNALFFFLHLKMQDDGQLNKKKKINFFCLNNFNLSGMF